MRISYQHKVAHNTCNFCMLKANSQLAIIKFSQSKMVPWTSKTKSINFWYRWHVISTDHFQIGGQANSVLMCIYNTSLWGRSIVLKVWQGTKHPLLSLWVWPYCRLSELTVYILGDDGQPCIRTLNVAATFVKFAMPPPMISTLPAGTDHGWGVTETCGRGLVDARYPSNPPFSGCVYHCLIVNLSNQKAWTSSTCVKLVW